MTDKEFRRLKRADLVEIIFQLQNNEDRLTDELTALKTQLNSGASETMARNPEDSEDGNSSCAAYHAEALPVPDREQVKNERNRLRYRRRFRRLLTSTIAVLIVAAAAAVLVATLFFSVLQVSGDSMEPTLSDGDVIVLVKSSSFKTGDLVGIRYEGKVLLKRVIGGPGDYIDMDAEGNVSVNGVQLDESYVLEKSLGECDLTFPYQVPDNSWFVLGDHRSVSVDSRSTRVGCIRKEQIIGKVYNLFRIPCFHI